MPDITMCTGVVSRGGDDDMPVRCPFKEHCYRRTATPFRIGQSWFADAPFDIKNNACEYYIPVQPNKRVNLF